MVWLLDSEKTLMMFNCFDTIQACDVQMDGQTDILRQHSPHSTMQTVVQRGETEWSGWDKHLE